MLRTSFSIILLSLLIACKSAQYTPQVESVTSVEITDMPQDSLSLSLIQPYKNQLDKEVNEVIGYAAKDLEKSFPGDLIYFMTEAVESEAEKVYGKDIDFSAMYSGGVRIPSISEGPITVNKIFELMPFENEIVILTLDGATVKELIDHVADQEGSLFVNNTQIVVKDKSVKTLLINGKEFDSNKTYTLAISDYLAGGGSDMGYLKKALKYEPLNLKYRDMMINYIRNEQKQGRKIKKVSNSSITIER